jgi:NAD dependent epimerase/dehydratase family.
VVAVTTDKCYDNREWLHGYREEDPMGGSDPYSASKGAAELVIASFRRSFFSDDGPIKVASSRAGNVIGGGDWAIDRIVPDCIRAIRSASPVPIRNRTATRPWQHVLEPLSGYLWLGALLSEPHLNPLPSRGQSLCSAFNFGPPLGSNRTVAHLVSELIRHMGGQWICAADASAPHEASKLNLATDKAFHLLGWEAVWTFEETVQHTADWYVAEHSGNDVAEYTRNQIAAYEQAAIAKRIPWAFSC